MKKLIIDLLYLKYRCSIASTTPNKSVRNEVWLVKAVVFES